MDKLKNVLVYIAQNGLLSLALTGIGFSALSPLNIIRPVHAESKQSQPKEPVSITTPAVEQVQKQLLNSAVEFEENRGQFDKAVRFVAKAAGSTIFLTADEVVYVLPMGGTDETTSIHEGRPNEADLTRKEPATNTRHTAYAVRMKLVGANPASTYAGEDTAEHRTNYLRGSDESKWQTDVPNHTRVKYNDVYDGIGMVWHGKANGETQYDFVVEPFANVNQIVLEFDGANSLEIDADGNLLVHTAAGTVKQNKPFTYQEENGLQREISSGFIIQDKKVSFALGSYDRSKTLIVDPTTSLNVLSYSTFIGGSGVDNARQIALDGDNNAYVIARTNVAGYPTTSGTFDTTFTGSVDLAVPKLNASGSAFVYSTYVGGSGVDEGFDLAVDAAGNVYLAGYTDSTNYPVTANAFDTTFNGGGGDAFVTKLNATGSALLYSSFVGGTGFDGGASLAIDANSNVYLGGSTNSSNFPTTTGAFDVTLNGGLDAFVAKLNTVTPFLFYATYIGGTGEDSSDDLKVDASGNVYIAGTTQKH
ncbi:MAG: SBBP repeat-containing protein [Acidobacteria bacterium]|nr:SBBP repeat-containing protein [Acidobacteriota bacterium]